MEYNILMIFFSILAVFDVFFVKVKKKKIYLIVLIFITYLFFFGLRGFIAWDWSIYYLSYLNSIPLFSALKNGENIFRISNCEIGYQIWLSFMRSFFSEWNTYLFFTTFIDIICLLLIFYKYSPYPIFSVVIFLGFYGIVIQLDLMRNFKAILVFLFSIDYLVSNKKIRYIIWNLVSISFHRSCIVFLLVGYFLKKNLYKYKKIICIFFGTGVIFLIFSDSILRNILIIIRNFLINNELEIFSNITFKLDFYLNSNSIEARDFSLFGFIERIFTFILFFIYREKINKSKYGKVFFNIYLLYIFTYLYCSGVKIVFERLGLLFVCSYWILYPILLENMPKLKKSVLFFIIIILCILKVNVIIKGNSMTKELYEYKNILWNKETYEEKIQILEKVKDNINNIK